MPQHEANIFHPWLLDRGDVWVKNSMALLSIEAQS